MRIQSLLVILGVLAGVTAAAAPVKKVAVEKRDLRRVVRTSASVAPRLWASLSAPAGGMVKEVSTDLGNRVKHGQRLAVVEPARGGKPMAVLAPFDGVVIARNAQPGVFTPDGAGLFTVIDDSVVRIELDVPEVDALLVRPGQPLNVRFDALPAHAYHSQLALIVPWVDPRSHSLHADAEVANPDRLLIAGMTGEAAIDVESRSGVLAIPQVAVQREGNQSFVFKLDGDHARRVAVTLGIDDGGEVEVVSGLAAADVVLIGALHDGDAVPQPR